MTVAATLFAFGVYAQDVIVNPEVSYAGTPRECIIGGITVTHFENTPDFTLIGLSGLQVGQKIDLPGDQITDAVKRYWKNQLFSDVSISVDSLVGNKAYLHIHLKMNPRVSTVNYYGLKKSEREDMEKKLGILVGAQITRDMLDRAKLIAKSYFDDKGFKNAEIDVQQRPDVTKEDFVILDFIVDKKQKMKVREIIIDGNNALPDKKLKGGFLRKGAFAKTHEAGKFSSFFKSKKFTTERWNEDKKNLIAKYNEYGYRDAVILEDSVWNVDENHVNVYVKIDEGQQYFIRNVTWVGNTVYPTDFLNRSLDMKKGDVYNPKLMNKRLTEDDDAVGNNYWNNGYIFYQLDPAEVNIVGDSIDLEMRITEGPQARISHVRINGNDRLYENVVRRELQTKPGDLFSKEALMRSMREMASMGHFDPEAISPDTKPDYLNGTVDINWQLQQKSNDQIEFSLGWGQTGVIGRVGLKLNNFSIRNLFRKNAEHRGIMPIGDGEVFSLGAQTNGTYYQSYNASYSTAWFGGKRPIQFSVGMYYSKQTDVSSNFYNSAWQNNYLNYMYGYGGYGYGYGYNNYENYYDPDKYVQLIGASLGWGKRLRWPDDHFMLSVQLAYTRYMLKNWQYFLLTTGKSNNLNLSLQINRSSTDNQLFPRTGSEFTASVTITPPWSKFDNIDYENLATNPKSPTYNDEQQKKPTAADSGWKEPRHTVLFPARSAKAGANKSKAGSARRAIRPCAQDNRRRNIPAPWY